MHSEGPAGQTREDVQNNANLLEENERESHVLKDEDEQPGRGRRRATSTGKIAWDGRMTRQAQNLRRRWQRRKIEEMDKELVDAERDGKPAGVYKLTKALSGCHGPTADALSKVRSQGTAENCDHGEEKRNWARGADENRSGGSRHERRKRGERSIVQYLERVCHLCQKENLFQTGRVERDLAAALVQPNAKRRLPHVIYHTVFKEGAEKQESLPWEHGFFPSRRIEEAVPVCEIAFLTGHLDGNCTVETLHDATDAFSCMIQEAFRETTRRHLNDR